MHFRLPTTVNIDGAFVDRADLKLYIGHPTVAGRYQILASALRELVRAGIIVQRVRTPRRSVLMLSRANCSSLEW